LHHHIGTAETDRLLADQGFAKVHIATQPTRRRSHNFRLASLAAIAALVLFLPAATRADSNATYTFSGSLSDSSGFSGTLDFNTSGGVTTLVNSNFTIGGTTFSCNGASSNTCIVQNSGFADYFQALSGSSLVLLSWNPFDFSNPPSTFNFNGGYCLNCASGIFTWVSDGNAVATPEPLTWLMLAVGLLAVLLFPRRRRSKIAVD
jgi:hypothetical protein